MELTQNEKKLISQADKSFRFSLVLGALMIVVPILFTFYIKAAPMERMEKIFPGLVEMRNLVERDAKYLEIYKGKAANQREIDLIIGAQRELNHEGLERQTHENKEARNDRHDDSNQVVSRTIIANWDATD